MPGSTIPEWPSAAWERVQHVAFRPEKHRTDHQQCCWLPALTTNLSAACRVNCDQSQLTVSGLCARNDMDSVYAQVPDTCKMYCTEHSCTAIEQKGCSQGKRLHAVIPQQACSWEEACWPAGCHLPNGSSPAALPACRSVAAEQLHQPLDH